MQIDQSEKYLDFTSEKDYGKTFIMFEIHWRKERCKKVYERMIASPGRYEQDQAYDYLIRCEKDGWVDFIIIIP